MDVPTNKHASLVITRPHSNQHNIITVTFLNYHYITLHTVPPVMHGSAGLSALFYLSLSRDIVSHIYIYLLLI